MQPTLPTMPVETWRKVKRTDRRARELADRHYSRQTPGAADFKVVEGMLRDKASTYMGDHAGAGL